MISPKLSLVAEKFPGQAHFHDLKPTDSCQKIINFLEQICHAGDIIVLIDITNLCLEYLFWEDIAFYHELSEQNQYLKAVSFLDISDEREFPRVIHEIEDHAEQRIFDFLENYGQLQAPLLAEVLKSMGD